jgi:hypothetical protein
VKCDSTTAGAARACPDGCVLAWIFLLLTTLVACAHQGVARNAGEHRGADNVATVSSNELVVQAIFDAEGRNLCENGCPAMPTVAPGRCRVVVRPRRWPHRAWGADVELRANTSYLVRIDQIAYGEAAAAGEPVFDRLYQTAVSVVELDSHEVVGVAVPLEELPALPPGAPMRADPRGQRCPPMHPRKGCAPLPRAWYSDGQPAPAL